MFHDTKFTDKGNGFRFANSGGIADTTLLSIATQFKTGVSRKYKMLPARMISQIFSKAGDVLNTIKYDGEGTFVFFDSEKDICVAFNAPSGRTRIGLPCLQNAAKALKAAKVKKALFVAECYLKTPAGQRSRSGDVSHITANGSKEERENLALAFYDAIMLDGKDLRENQKDCIKTWDKLGEIFGTDYSQNCHRAEGEIIPGSKMEAWFKTITEERGLEGIVARFLNNETIYKIKPSLSIDTVAVGYVEGDFEGKYGVLSILCALTDPEGKTLQVLCRVGSGFSDDQRESLLENFQTLKTDSPVRMTDSDGRPITFLKPKIVVEVEGEAIMDTFLDGEAVTSQTLKWDKEKLTFAGISPSAHLTHATFVRLRDDKVWDDGGTRMSQALSEENIKTILAPKQKENPTPILHLREVYAKTTKGETSVKKIVVVERNAPGFHRFTLHWTDFSPSRKDALKTETQGVDSLDRLAEILAPYREEVGKKGWEAA